MWGLIFFTLFLLVRGWDGEEEDLKRGITAGVPFPAICLPLSEKWLKEECKDAVTKLGMKHNSDIYPSAFNIRLDNWHSGCTGWKSANVPPPSFCTGRPGVAFAPRFTGFGTSHASEVINILNKCEKAACPRVEKYRMPPCECAEWDEYCHYGEWSCLNELYQES